MYFEFILSIISSSLLLNIFKYFEKYKVVTLNAIVVNYLIAGSLSFIVQGDEFSLTQAINESWFGLALLLGFLFITLFNVMAYSSQILGIASTSIANKITFIFPAFLWIIFYNEPVSIIKILGLVIALIAIFLTYEKSENTSIKKGFLLLVILFIGGGALDSLLSYGQQELVPFEDTSKFFGYLFLFAFCFGLILMIIQIVRTKIMISKKDILWGIILGIPNFGSMFFFLRSLTEIPTSTAFPVANMGVIVGSTLLSMLLFKEKISKKKFFALLAAIGAIAIISFHSEIRNLF